MLTPLVINRDSLDEIAQNIKFVSKSIAKAYGRKYLKIASEFLSNEEDEAGGGGDLGGGGDKMPKIDNDEFVNKNIEKKDNSEEKPGDASVLPNTKDDIESNDAKDLIDPEKPKKADNEVKIKMEIIGHNQTFEDIPNNESQSNSGTSNMTDLREKIMAQAKIDESDDEEEFTENVEEEEGEDEDSKGEEEFDADDKDKEVDISFGTDESLSEISLSGYVNINQGLIREVKFNEQIKREFAQDNRLKELTEYNGNYIHDKIPTAVTERVLNRKWEKPNYIFNNRYSSIDVDFEITEIKTVHHHEFKSGRLWYAFRRPGIKEYYCCQLTNCYSNHLIDLIHSYLRLRELKGSSDITKSTRITELRNCYHKFKNKIDSSITLDLFLDPHTEKREKSNNFLPLVELTCDMINKVEEVFKTKDNELAFKVEFNNKERIVIAEDIKWINGGILFKKLEQTMLKKKLQPNVVKQNSDAFVMKEENKKIPKDKLRKKLAKLRFDKFYNENNCFYHAITKISDKFSDNIYRSLFKGPNYTAQFDIANDQLKKHGQELVQIFDGIAVLSEYIKSIKGTSMVVFYKSISAMHVEPVIDGEFINSLQKHTNNMMNQNVHIIEWRLV